MSKALQIDRLQEPTSSAAGRAARSPETGSASAPRFLHQHNGGVESSNRRAGPEHCQLLSACTADRRRAWPPEFEILLAPSFGALLTGGHCRAAPLCHVTLRRPPRAAPVALPSTPSPRRRASTAWPRAVDATWRGRTPSTRIDVTPHAIDGTPRPRRPSRRPRLRPQRHVPRGLCGDEEEGRSR